MVHYTILSKCLSFLAFTFLMLGKHSILNYPTNGFSAAFLGWPFHILKNLIFIYLFSTPFIAIRFSFFLSYFSVVNLPFQFSFFFFPLSSILNFFSIQEFEMVIVSPQLLSLIMPLFLVGSPPSLQNQIHNLPLNFACMKRVQ